MDYTTRFICPWNSPGKYTGVDTIAFSRGSFGPRDQTWFPCIIDRFFTVWATRELEITYMWNQKKKKKRYKWPYIQNRDIPTDIEINLWLPEEKGGGERDKLGLTSTRTYCVAQGASLSILKQPIRGKNLKKIIYTHTHTPQLNHSAVYLKLTQHYKSTILQLPKKKKVLFVFGSKYTPYGISILSCPGKQNVYCGQVCSWACWHYKEYKLLKHWGGWVQVSIIHMNSALFLQLFHTPKIISK